MMKKKKKKRGTISQDFVNKPVKLIFREPAHGQHHRNTEKAKGRPTFCTPEIVARTRVILPKLLYVDTLGDYLGVHRMVWRAWLKNGVAEVKRLIKDPAAAPDTKSAIFVEFYYAVKYGMAKAEKNLIGTITKAAQDQWQAAAWALERRWPAKWGKDSREIRELRDNLTMLMKEIENVAKAKPAIIFTEGNVQKTRAIAKLEDGDEE